MRVCGLVLVMLVAIRAASWSDSLRLNAVGIQVINKTASVAEKRGGYSAQSSRGNLAQVGEIGIDHGMLSPDGSISLQAFLAYLKDDPAISKQMLEALVEVDGTGRPFVKFWLAQAYFDTDGHKQALLLLLEVGAVQQLCDLGEFLTIQGQWADAATAYQGCFSGGRDDVRTALRLGQALEQTGRQDEALAVYEWAARQFPTNYGPYVAAGNLHRESGAFEEALIWYDLAVRETGEIENTHINASRVYEMQGDLPHALEQLRIVTKRQPGSCRAWGRIGLIEYKRGRFPESVRALERAVARCPQIPWLYEALGGANEAEGDVEGATCARRMLQVLCSYKVAQ
jgi:tetratricopeptide (TPR) repeat protein